MAQRALRIDELSRWTPSGLLPEPVDPAQMDDGWRPFPFDALPDPLKAFVTQGAASIGCDESYIGVPLLAALAGCIGNSRTARLKNGWDEACVIWGAAIGESGTSKSPALDLVTRPLQEMAVDQLREHETAMAHHAREMSMHEADYAEWKKKGRGTGEPPPTEPEPPICKRTLVSDATVEALGVLLHENPRGLLLCRDEVAGLFFGMNQYKGGKGGDTQHFLSMHGARPMIVDRKGGGGAKGSGKRTMVVPRAAVSICGTIQPEILKQALGREHFQDGLAARLFMACPPSRAKQWTDAEVSTDQQKTIASLYHRLVGLECDTDERGELIPRALPLTESGKARWVKFYNEHAAEHATLSGDLAAAWSKLEGGAARIALVIHCVRQVWLDFNLESPDAIDGESIAAGVTLSRWFAHEARRIYGVFGESEEARDRRKVVEWVTKNGGRATARELSRSNLGYDPEGAELALTDCGKAGLGQWQFIRSGEKGGRPTSVFVLYEVIPGQNGRVKSGHQNDARPKQADWDRDEAAHAAHQLQESCTSNDGNLDDANRMLDEIAGEEQ